MKARPSSAFVISNKDSDVDLQQYPKQMALGIINGKASNLVKPPYPAAAKAVRASGIVNVSVLIDEAGNVISAKAVSGHPLLRDASEKAAMASRFTPTIINGQALRVTGIITYTFTALK